jgi:endonuclease/exonuclease/phosphatase family metal-dependent hydrolase
MAGSRKTVLDGIFYFINVITAVGLLLSYLAYYIPPGTLSLFSFIALGYPVLLIINIAFLFYWLIRFKRKVFLPLVCIAIGYLHVPRTYQFGTTKKVVNTDERIKVMSFNVRLQNQYLWLDDAEIPRKIYDLIDIENPDVLLLQEYRKEWPEAPKNLGYKYVHRRMSKNGEYGSAIFSRFPIKGSQVLDFEGDSLTNNQFHLADIEWNGQTIRFINVHLASVGLGDADYKLLENPEQEEQEKLEKGLRSIASSLDKAFKRRGTQIESVKRAVADSPHPVVLSGDFNDVPQSYVYHQMALDLSDSYMESGHGFSKTYVKSPIPLRIDYIFHSPTLKAFNYKAINEELSDHYPIVTELELNTTETL